MKLNEWANKQAKALNVSKSEVLKRLGDKSDVSMITIKSVANGMRMGNYTKAKAVSDATNGAVTIKDLCE